MPIPVALGSMLGQVPAVQRGWRRLPQIERERYINWVDSGTTPERQESRARVAARLIARGERLPGRLRRFLLRGRPPGPAYDLTDDAGGYMAGGYPDW